MNDVRYAFRGLRKYPGFSLTIVLTLALGIGATATVFALVNPLLFKKLPYPESERLVRVHRTSRESQSWPHSVRSFLRQRESNTVFDYLVAVKRFPGVNLTIAGSPAERLAAMFTTADFFPMMAVQPAIGRVFRSDEDQPGVAKVAVLSNRFWQTHFFADRGILGRTLRLDDQEVTVVGVMPEGYENPLLWGPIDIWMPIAFTPQQKQDGGNNYLTEVARLKKGVAVAEADGSMKTLSDRFSREMTMGMEGESIRIEPLQRSVAGGNLWRQMSAFTFGLTAVLLLISCINVATVQLARTASRAREFAVRGALGGGRRRLLRQTVTEHLFVSLVGAVLALPISILCTQWIGSQMAIGISNSPSSGLNFSFDIVSFAFALTCAILTGIAFGAIPAWLAASTDVMETLKQNSGSVTSGRSHRRFRHTLIVAEIAFTLILLTGAAIFIRGLERITTTDRGWRADHVLLAGIPLNGPSYGTAEQRVAFFDRLSAQLAGIPGVDSFALSASKPSVGFDSTSTFIEEGRPNDTFIAYNEGVTPQYFATLQMHLREGRSFTPQDKMDSNRVMIINETMARRLWPGESAIGKRVGFGGNSPWREVVGVVEDVRFPSNMSSVDTEFQTYRPLSQFAVQWPGAANMPWIELRTLGSPESLAADVRRIVRQIDAGLPVVSIQTAQEALALDLIGLQLVGRLLGSFALLAVLLAGVGLFGVISYSVAQRTSEMGIRIAIGARRAEVMWLVLKQGAALTAAGAFLGITGGLLLRRGLSAALPRLPGIEPGLMGLTVAVFIVFAVVACSIPARRASTIDPVTALRGE